MKKKKIPWTFYRVPWILMKFHLDSKDLYKINAENKIFKTIFIFIHEKNAIISLY
jgi:hypothetical protein